MLCLRLALGLTEQRCVVLLVVGAREHHQQIGHHALERLQGLLQGGPPILAQPEPAACFHAVASNVAATVCRCLHGTMKRRSLLLGFGIPGATALSGGGPVYALNSHGLAPKTPVP